MDELDLDALDIDAPAPLVIEERRRPPPPPQQTPEPTRQKRKSPPKVRRVPQSVSEERIAKWQDSIDVFSLFVDKPISKRRTTVAAATGGGGGGDEAGGGAGEEEAGKNQLWLTLYNGSAHLELNETSRRRFYIVSQTPKAAKPSPAGPTASVTTTTKKPPVVFASVHSAFRYGLGITDENVVVQLSAYCTDAPATMVGNAKMVSADGGGPLPAGVVINLKRLTSETNGDVLRRELENLIRAYEIPPGFTDFAVEPTIKLRTLVEGSKEEYRAHWHIRIPVQMRERYQPSSAQGSISLRGSLGPLTQAEQKAMLLETRSLGKAPPGRTEVPVGKTEVTQAYTGDTAFRFLCDTVSHEAPLRPYDYDTPKATTMSYTQTTPVGDVMTARRIEQHDRANMLTSPESLATTDSRMLRYLMARSFGESDRRTFFIVHNPRSFNTMRGAAEFNGPNVSDPIERVPLSKLYSAAHFDPLAYLSFHSSLNRFILSVADIFPPADKPATHREVVNTLARLGRSFGAYVDKSHTKLLVMGQALGLRDFYDALSLNASNVENPPSHAYKTIAFEPSREQQSLSAISTDVYLDTFKTFAIDEPASIESELLDLDDESSFDMDKPLYKRHAPPGQSHDSQLFDDDDNGPPFSPTHPVDEESPSATRQKTTTAKKGTKRPFDALDKSRSDDNDDEEKSPSLADNEEPSSPPSVSLNDADVMEIDAPRHTLRSISPRGLGALMRIPNATLAYDMNEIIRAMREYDLGAGGADQSNKRAKLEDKVRPTRPPSSSPSSSSSSSSSSSPPHEDEKEKKKETADDDDVDVDD